MRCTLLPGVAVGIVIWIAPANAQLRGTPDFAPQSPTCGKWQEQVRSGQPDVMQALSGVWHSRNVIPATPGVSAAAPEDITMTRWPNGQLQYKKTACFTPARVPGVPPLPTSCADAIGHGGWYAYREQGNWMFVGIMMVGSSYNGVPTPANCSGVRVRFLDENHIVNESGGQGERIGGVQ
jgi:hypothetical protein